ncbi:hypothetical protein H4684_003704 [Desulfomicrobium macestii]|uniref:Uncharacterized protein n=1 Tax=Desulfomicrobium macestii TaxID=90731 RepID=A0ABR9H8K8_9BACT|nr:hypothetical protein [Desulfomicrobium macestii]MBE1427020.1 hypothetical protein [Desulfomicrobium macestii]
MQNRIKNEDFYQPDLDEFEPELKTRPASLSEKLHGWICAFADKAPGLMLKGVLIAIAMAAIYFNGYATAQSDFERAVTNGWYVKNATKFEEAAKNVITPSGAWALEKETK